VRRIAPYFAELGLPCPVVPTRVGESFEAQLEAALDSGASAFSFTFGLVPQAAIEALRRRGMVVLGTATTVDEALALEASGVDAVVAQGSEAGGHRGTFLRDARTSQIGTMALVPQVVDAVKLPVVASGGIMDGRGIVAARALGAVAVQMGTAFLTCDEAGTPAAYRAAVLAAREDETRVTRAYSGRAARGLVNRFMREVDTGRDDDPILPYPLQNALTRPLRAAAAAQGRSEFLSAWAGQGVRLARSRSAADLMIALAREIEETETRIAR
jgi:nitronate monooxygenase